MAALVIPAILSSSLFAFAGGLTPEPLGAEAFLSGVTPLGETFVIKEYMNYYRAKKLETNHGFGINHTVSLKTEGYALDKLQVIASTTRFIYISPLKISVVGLDGYLLGHAYIPVVSPRIKLDLPTDQSDHHTGIGDVIFGPGIGWHTKSGLFHFVTAVDITAPTGQWGPRRLVNVGNNVWSVSPLIAATLFLPWHPSLEFDIKIDYSFNSRNDDYIINGPTAAKIGNKSLVGVRTNLTPGQDFHVDYAIAYVLSKTGAEHQFRVGATGYFYRQTTDDETTVGRVKNNLGEVFAIGPGVWWTYKHWIAEVHIDYEVEARNRPQGINSWLTILYKF
jgi:hypothetical protein